MKTRIIIPRQFRCTCFYALFASLLGCAPVAEQVLPPQQAIAVKDELEILEPQDDQAFRVLWLPNYRDVYDHQLSRYDAIVLSGATDFAGHAHMLQTARRFRNLREDGRILQHEQWDLVAGKPTSGPGSDSPMVAPHVFGGWNPEWLARPRADWPNVDRAAADFRSAGLNMRHKEFLHDTMHAPLLGGRRDYLPYLISIGEDRTIRMNQLKCRASAPGYLSWRIKYALRWQRILRSDGILVGGRRYHQHWDDDLINREDWVCHHLKRHQQMGRGLPIGRGLHFAPSDEPFMDFVKAMFALPGYPEFGKLPRLGNYPLAKGPTLQHLRRYRPGQTGAWWNQRFAGALQHCHWWAMRYRTARVTEDPLAAYLRVLARESLQRGDLPLLTFESKPPKLIDHDVPHGGLLEATL